MKHPSNHHYAGILILAGFLLIACNPKANPNETNFQDSIDQDDTYQDSIDQDTTYLDSVRKNETEDPVDELLQDDSLSENNRDLRIP